MVNVGTEMENTLLFYFIQILFQYSRIQIIIITFNNFGNQDIALLSIEISAILISVDTVTYAKLKVSTYYISFKKY